MVMMNDVDAFFFFFRPWNDSGVGWLGAGVGVWKSLELGKFVLLDIPFR